MTAINHALTGALIGCVVSNPAIALPLAFLSHFALDAIPHYDPPGDTDEARINSKQFLYIQLVLGAVLCFVLVMAVFLAHPTHWLTIIFGAFFGASPDLISIPRYIHVKRVGRDIKNSWWFWRWHSVIQWKTGPRFALVELAWAIGAITLLVAYIR